MRNDLQEKVGTQWEIPQSWVENRNARRNPAPGIGTERFRILNKRKDFATENIICQMVKTPQ